MKQTNNIKLGMPNLNYNGLDETWLLKFCGNVHWDLLHTEVDVYGEKERFYASFFHIEVNFETSQNQYKENDIIKIKSELFKYNDKIYRSIHKFGKSNVIMDTIFVKKTDSGTLKKYRPKHTKTLCKEITEIGISEHQDKKREIFEKGTTWGQGTKLVFPPANLFNGVKILYCANYLYLVSLSEYTAHQKMFDPIKTLNISYYGNMLPSDALYGKTILSTEESQNTETTLFVNHTPIAYCEIRR